MGAKAHQGADSPLELILEGIQAEAQPDEEDARSDAQKQADQTNRHFSPFVDQFAMAKTKEGSIPVVMDVTKQAGSFSAMSFIRLTASREILILGMSASFRNENDGALTVKELAVEQVSSGHQPCANDGFRLPVSLFQEQAGTVSFAASSVEAEKVTYKKLSHSGQTVVCLMQ